MEAVHQLEKALGVTAKKNLMPMQLGDVKDTFAEITAAEVDIQFKPSVDLPEGIIQFVQWYKQYKGLE